MTPAEQEAFGFVQAINNAILYPLITVLTALALVIFLWGAFEYIYNAGNEEGRAKGKRHLIWGVIGMLVMISAFAILSIAAGTFSATNQQLDRSTGGFSSTGARPVPTPGSGSPDGSGTTGSPDGSGTTGSPEGSGTTGSIDGASLTTTELQDLVIADYEENTNISSSFYMRDVRAMTTDIDGVDRIEEIQLAEYRGYISEETANILLEASLANQESAQSIDTTTGSDITTTTLDPVEGCERSPYSPSDPEYTGEWICE